MENMVKTSIKLPTELIENMKMIAEKKMTSFSQAMREALIEYIEKNGKK